MPTARQTHGKTLGRNALLQLAGSEDQQAFVRELLSSVVLKEDLKTPSPDQGTGAHGTASLPSMRDVMFTREGGIAVRVLADEDLHKGEIVTAGDSGYISCRKTVAGYEATTPPFGVVFEDVAAGDIATVVIAGMARVKMATGGES